MRVELKNRDKLERNLSRYFKEVHKIYMDGDFREESFYSSLKELIEECSIVFSSQESTRVLVLPKKAEAGIPDFRIGKNGEIVGYIEAKLPDANLEELEDSDQIKRYRESLPNLILTNFLEFRLYKEGNLVDNVEVGRKFTLQTLKFPPNLKSSNHSMSCCKNSSPSPLQRFKNPLISLLSWPSELDFLSTSYKKS